MVQMDSAQRIIDRLVGQPAPTVRLPWTTYADCHDLLGPGAHTSLADLAKRDTLAVYFFPTEDESEGPCADTMGRIYRANDREIARQQARVVGVGTQTALAQQEIALVELFPQLLLSDHELRLAHTLGLPTEKIADRDEYQAMTLLIHHMRIARVVYPVASPRIHMSVVLSYLTELKDQR